MVNPLKYTPKKGKAALSTGGVSFSVGVSEYSGMESFGRSMIDAASKINTLLQHMDQVEDTNNMNRMLSSHDITMAESVVAYESSDHGIDNYSQEVGKMFDDQEQATRDSYKFKTASVQAQFNKAIEGRRTQTTLASKQRELVLRAERAGAQFAENMTSTYQASVMNPSYEAGKAQMIAEFDRIGEQAIMDGVTTEKDLQQQIAKHLNRYDWYNINEQIEAYPHEMKRMLADEKAIFDKWGDLTPENILALRKVADNQIKQKDQREQDAKSEAIDKYDRGYIDLRKKFYEETTAAGRDNIVEQLKAYVHKGAELKGANWVESRLNDLYNPKVKPNPAAMIKIVQGIKDGTIRDKRVWVQAGESGMLTPEQVEQCDKHHQNYMKNHGQHNQWTTPGGVYDLAKGRFGDKETPKYQRFINTMHHIQLRTGWADNDPRLKQAATKLMDSMGASMDVESEDLGFWGTRPDTHDMLDEYKPWEHGDQPWKYSSEFDFRIPTADPAEIKDVYAQWEAINRERRMAGKPIFPKTAKNLQLILQRKRGDL